MTRQETSPSTFGRVDKVADTLRLVATPIKLQELVAYSEVVQLRLAQCLLGAEVLNLNAAQPFGAQCRRSDQEQPDRFVLQVGRIAELENRGQVIGGFSGTDGEKVALALVAKVWEQSRIVVVHVDGDRVHSARCERVPEKKVLFVVLVESVHVADFEGAFLCSAGLLAQCGFIYLHRAFLHARVAPAIQAVWLLGCLFVLF